MKILFVCYRSPGGEIIKHPSHEKMLDDYNYDNSYVEKNWVPFNKMYESSFSNLNVDVDYNGNKNENYDIIILESPVSLQAAKELDKSYPNSNIVYLNSNWMLWPELAHRFYGNYKSFKDLMLTFERALNKKMLLKRLRKNVDYSISVSEFCDKKLKQICESESYVVEPFIEESRYNKLNRISPDLESKNALFIGENRDHKGVDIMVEAWSKVIKDYPKAKLKIVGEGHPPEFDNCKGVDVMGYVSDKELYKFIEESCLYLHTARFENFGISVVEAMRGGLPCIVSENTGTKDLVSKVDSSLVVKSEADEVSKRVCEYFKLSNQTKENFSEKSRNTTSIYTLDRTKGMMEKALKDITS